MDKSTSNEFSTPANSCEATLNRVIGTEPVRSLPSPTYELNRQDPLQILWEPTLFITEQQKLMKTGSCLNCRAPGHPVKDCSLKKRARAVTYDTKLSKMRILEMISRRETSHPRKSFLKAGTDD